MGKLCAPKKLMGRCGQGMTREPEEVIGVGTYLRARARVHVRVCVGLGLEQINLAGGNLPLLFKENHRKAWEATWLRGLHACTSV